MERNAFFDDVSMLSRVVDGGDVHAGSVGITGHIESWEVVERSRPCSSC